MKEMLMNLMGFVIYLIGASGILVLTNYKGLGENDLLFIVSLFSSGSMVFYPALKHWTNWVRRQFNEEQL